MDVSQSSVIAYKLFPWTPLLRIASKHITGTDATFFPSSFASSLPFQVCILYNSSSVEEWIAGQRTSVDQWWIDWIDCCPPLLSTEFCFGSHLFFFQWFCGICLAVSFVKRLRYFVVMRLGIAFVSRSFEASQQQRKFQRIPARLSSIAAILSKATATAPTAFAAPSAPAAHAAAHALHFPR